MTNALIPTIDDEEASQLVPSTTRVVDLVARADATIAVAHALTRATLGLTYAEDWVRMEADGKVSYYLQNQGAQRASKLWKVAFDKINVHDFQREEIPGGHIRYSVLVTGHSEQTGEEETEIGTRSSSSQFFRSRWERALEAEDHATLDQLEMDIKKAALTNGKGRVRRALTGTAGVPESVLKNAGIDTSRCPGFRFKGRGEGQEGAAPAGTGATSKQLYALSMEACRGVVTDLEKIDQRRILTRLEAMDLDRKRVSDLIDLLKKTDAKKQRFSQASFWKALGVSPEPGAAPPADRPAPGQPGAQAEPEREAPPPEGTVPPRCPGCDRTWDLVASNGHAQGCTYEGPTP